MMILLYWDTHRWCHLYLLGFGVQTICFKVLGAVYDPKWYNDYFAILGQPQVVPLIFAGFSDFSHQKQPSDSAIISKMCGSWLAHCFFCDGNALAHCFYFTFLIDKLWGFLARILLLLLIKCINKFCVAHDWLTVFSAMVTYWLTVFISLFG